MIKGYKTKKENYKDTKNLKLSDFNNRETLLRFCERQYNATKDAIRESEIEAAKSLARTLRYPTC